MGRSKKYQPEQVVNLLRQIDQAGRRRVFARSKRR